MTAINVFSLSLGISLSFSRTHINYLPYHILSLSCTRSLILSKILVAKAIRRVPRGTSILYWRYAEQIFYGAIFFTSLSFIFFTSLSFS